MGGFIQSEDSVSCAEFERVGDDVSVTKHWWRQQRNQVTVTLGVCAVVVAALVTIAVTRPTPPPFVPSAEQQAIALPTTGEQPQSLPPLRLPKAGDEIAFVGDSWTEGYGATPETLGFAYLTAQHFQATAVIHSAAGSGYGNPGKRGKGPYLKVFTDMPVDTAARLLIVQGSGNDGGQLGLGNTMRDTLTVAHRKFPNAAVVVLGPMIATSRQYDMIVSTNSPLVWAARQTGSYVINATGRNWITPRIIDDYIDPLTEHPSTVGHHYIAVKLVQALEEFSRSGQSPTGY